MWSNSSLLGVGPSSAAEESVSVLCLSKVAICFPRTTEIMLVWYRAGDRRSVSVGLIFPLFLSAGAPGASLSGFDGPIEGLARCALV